MPDTYPTTVFIVGAGASRDFGDNMPIATDLAQRIEGSLNNELSAQSHVDGPIVSAIKQHYGSFSSEHQWAAHKIRRAIHSKESIDDLLDEWRESEPMLQVGKIAIAHVIQTAECNSVLARNADNEDRFLQDVTTLRDTWLGQLARHVGPDKRRRYLAEALTDVGFIIFNYDRCVEHMLYGELLCTTDLNADEARSYVSNMPIVHPYGSLGAHDGPNAVAKYGRHSEFLGKMAEGIRTYTEERRNTSDLSRMRDMLTNAARTVFLGFGYHPKNLDLLLESGLNLQSDIYGACLAPNQIRLNAAKRRLFPNGIGQPENLFSVGCADFVSGSRDALFGAAS